MIDQQEALEQVRLRLPEVEFIVDLEELAGLSLDTYWTAKARAYFGKPFKADGAARPRDAAQVAALLAAASEVGLQVVPRSGGSGSQGGAVPQLGGLIVDMSAMNQIIELDEASRTVTVQAGVGGWDLEEWLNERGYMFPHYPASVHLAQVGGYLAAKGSGTMSTKYGKIEDLVASMEVALPSGELIRTPAVPRHAVGPDLNQLYIGSEGTLGIITETTLLVRELPEHRGFATYTFPDLASGMHAVRDIIHKGWRPALARLYDDSATRTNLSKAVGDELTGIYLTMMFDGPRPLVDVELAQAEAMLAAAGGTSLGPELAQGLWENRYKIYYAKDWPDLPKMWGTADIVASYDRILPAYEALSECMAGYADHNLEFSGHLSHWYPWGTMVYGRWVIPQAPDDMDEAIALYDEIWRKSSEVILAAGALLNDHHGIGLKLADDVEDQFGPAFGVLRSIKGALDPAGIMNRGKLGL